MRDKDIAKGECLAGRPTPLGGMTQLDNKRQPTEVIDDDENIIQITK